MPAQMKIAVAGATGRVGRHVVDVLEERGYDVVAMSRSSRVDVLTGDGLADAPGGRGVHHRRRHRFLTGSGGGHRVLHRRGAEPARGRRARRRAVTAGIMRTRLRCQKKWCRKNR